MLESPSSLTLTFLSTPSVRRATNEVVRGDVLIEFLSTSPARRETRRLRRGRPMVPISIHALCEESDHSTVRGGNCA